MNIQTPGLNRLIDSWLEEDIGRGDLTSIALLDKIGSAYWIAKQKGIFCGGPLVKQIFQHLDPSIKVRLLIKDGESFTYNQRLLVINGPAASLATGERTALNLSMRLSGIATATSALVQELNGTKVRLADTRKTTPGLRLLEKYAFRCGGGINHRLGLDDAAMLKENHIAWGGGITKTLKKIKMSSPWPAKIIVEVETPNQAKEAIKAGADGILLDEISPAILTDLVPELRILDKKMFNDDGYQRTILEASGINPSHLKAYAKTGIDLISTSAPITRSDWIDISMRFENVN